MKKRMLSALLALCMMLTMMPAAFAVGTDDSSSSESVSTTLPEAKDGVYTLDEDVSINTIGLGAGETVYDLNGHTLTYTGGTVQPQQGQTLTFRDSSVSGTERRGTLKLTGVIAHLPYSVTHRLLDKSDLCASILRAPGTATSAATPFTTISRTNTT